jgi:hypothetical protein
MTFAGGAKLRSANAFKCIYFVSFYITGYTNYTANLSGGWRQGVVWPYAILAGALFAIRLSVVR